MNRALTILALATGNLVLSEHAEARSKVSLSQAESTCLKRAERAANIPSRPNGDFLHPNQLKDRFRACVWAKSGQYPSVKLNIRGQRITPVAR